MKRSRLNEAAEGGPGPLRWQRKRTNPLYAYCTIGEQVWDAKAEKYVQIINCAVPKADGEPCGKDLNTVIGEQTTARLLYHFSTRHTRIFAEE